MPHLHFLNLDSLIALTTMVPLVLALLIHVVVRTMATTMVLPLEPAELIVVTAVAMMLKSSMLMLLPHLHLLDLNSLIAWTTVVPPMLTLLIHVVVRTMATTMVLPLESTELVVVTTVAMMSKSSMLMMLPTSIFSILIT